jgi:SAM-dependent methyltransferase
MTISAEDVSRLQLQYGLSYHIPYLLHAESFVKFSEKSVIEVGGSLPERFVFDELGVSRWAAVEELGYWNEISQDRPLTAARPIAETGSINNLPPYAVLTGRMEDAPFQLNEKFDIAVSIAAFEHMDRFPASLDAIHRVLKPGGVLFSLFSPVWSAQDGHHLPDILDSNGVRFDPSIIPHWGHLLMSPSEMYKFLTQKTDKRTAAEIVYYIYNSPHINRLFVEDYINYIEQSSFKSINISVLFPHPINKEEQGSLERLHPGKKIFSTQGVLLVLQR